MLNLMKTHLAIDVHNTTLNNHKMIPNYFRIIYFLAGGYFLFSSIMAYKDNRMTEVFTSVIIALMFYVMLFNMAKRIRLSILLGLCLILIGTLFIK